MRIAKKTLLVLGIFCALVVLLNFDFFWQNARYTFVKSKSPVAGAGQKVTEPDFLSIESLGIKTPVVYVQEKSEKVYQSALINGVVHFPGTALPGESGNVYIFGHSSDFIFSKGHYKTVFALLPRIEKGAEIKITGRQGEEFSYIVSNSFPASAGDVKYLKQDMSKKTLTIQTSWPLGTALKRYIVKAEMRE